MNQFKRKLTAFTAMLAFLSLSSAASFAGGIDTSAGNVLGKTGNMSFQDKSDVRTDVNLNGGARAVGQVDWKDFSIAAGKHVNFGFSGISQTIINRVLGGRTSEIMGRMTSSCINGGTCSANNETGKVILINPAGVLFGQGSQVDINSLTTSTFDMKGAQNLKGMSESDLAAYQNNVLNKAASVVELDSNYVQAFKDAGITNADEMIKNSAIRLNGATFTHWDRPNGQFDFSKESTNNTNKSLAFVANHIDYKDSLLRTGTNYNYAPVGVEPNSLSNVKLITADGVTFGYLANGYIDKQTLASNDNHPEVARTITMDNSGLLEKDPTKAAIVSGQINIEQRSQVADSNKPSVQIKNSIIKGVKLINRENGDIVITGSQDILVDNSRLDTKNTYLKDSNGNILKSTEDIYGGEVFIEGGKNVTVKDSTIVTAGSKGNLTTGISSETSGAVRILAGTGDAKVENSKIVANGHAQVKSSGKVNINNSMIQAYNTKDTTTEKDITIIGTKGVNVHNTDMLSKGDIKIQAADRSTGKYTGDVAITGDSSKNIAENDANQPYIQAGGQLSIEGKNTTLDNVTLAYNEADGLKFADLTKSGADYVNNVTVKNNTAFAPLKNEVDANGNHYIADNVKIETNGNLTFDHATVKRQTGKLKTDRKDGNGNTGYNLDPDVYDLNDNGQVDGIRYITENNPAKADAVNLNVLSTQGNVTVTNGSNINATNGLMATATNGNFVENGASTVSAGNNVSITAKNDSITANSTVQAGNNVVINATRGNITTDSSKVIAKTGNAGLIAHAGAIDTLNNSQVEAGNDVNIRATGNVTVDKSQVIAGSDSQGFDVTNDPNDTIGSANITSTSGSVNIKDSKVLSQDKDVNITAYNTITFGNEGSDNINKATDITALHNVNIKSTNGNIEGEKTTMPTIKYGDRLTFDAAKSNIFTSQDSLKSVNVDYIAGEGNKFYTQGDIQFVNSSLDAPKNFVESGKDVILNNLEIKQATDKPEDTVTEIYANGNVTTYNVTGEDLGAKDAGNYHSYPQSVSTDRVAKGDKTMPEYVKGLESTKLNINDTKLKVTTDTVKDANNPDNGSITLVLQNADNTKAGVELKARNVDKLNQDPTTGDFKQGYYKTGTTKWDENINPKEGPEIVLGSADGQIAIKELYSDKLTLNPNDKMFADNTDGTPVITVKDQGGLNLDPELDYHTGDGKDPQGFTYDRNYDSKDINTTGGDLTFDDWSEWKPIKEWDDPDGTHHIQYESTRDGRITDRITTQTDQRHTITFDNEGNPGEFTLVYDKKSTTVEPGRDITAQNVKDDPSILDDIIKPTPDNPDPDQPTPEDFIKTKTDDTPCGPLPVVDREPDDVPTSDVSLVTLPREQVEVSRTSTVVDNTADQTASIMSAAARVDLGQEIEATYDDDDDDLDVE